MELYPHQLQVLEQTKDLNRVAYYLDMGLGKTFVGAEKMMQLGNNVNLVVCQKSKVQDWVDHFKTYYPKAVVDDMTDSNERVHFFTYSAFNDPFILIGVINYDLLFRKNVLLQLKNFTLMLDESSLIQNEKAKRTQFVLKMNPENVILLSGTPTSGKFENLWTQSHLLGWKISSQCFQRQYVNWTTIDMGGVPLRLVDKSNPYKNIERLKKKLREHGAVFMKTEECFELPEQNFIDVPVSASREYWKFRKNCVITIDTKNLCEFEDDSDFYGVDVTPRTELVGDTTLKRMLYERMLCGIYSREKIQVFKDLIASTQDRLIVFYNFNEELEKLKNVILNIERPISQVNGSVKDLSAYENEENSVTFVQYQAGAMGLNLQKANKVIYFTLPLMSELFEQSKKRIHRIGQTHACFYYTLTVKDSVEEQIKETLEMRKDYTDKLFELESGGML